MAPPPQYKDTPIIKLHSTLRQDSANIDEKDAYRHILFSIRLTRTFGKDIAQRVLNAHERKTNQSRRDRLMDLNNNLIGVQATLDPKNKNKKDTELAIEVMQNKKLIKNGVIIKD